MPEKQSFKGKYGSSKNTKFPKANNYLTIIHQSGEYPSLSPTPRRIIVLVYTTQGPKRYFMWQAVRNFKISQTGCLKVNSTSEFTNPERAKSTIYLCGIYYGLKVGVFRLQKKKLKISTGNFPLGRARSICHEFHIEGAEGGLAAWKIAKGMELVIKTIKMRNL